MGGLPVERLRHYLRQLSPAARALLITEFERGLLRGDEIPGGDLVLQEVRSALRESGVQAPRIGNAARLLFRPLEPFLIDEPSAQKSQGRIPRASLEPIWTWIGRDLVPAEARAFADAVSKALTAGDTQACEQLTCAFQDHVAVKIQQALAVSDDKARRRLAAQVGTVHALDDLRDFSEILVARDMLALIGDRLPGHIRNLADGALDTVKSVLDALAVPESGLLPYALILVMSRLEASWQLIRIAVRAAQSDNATRIGSTPYGLAITIVLADIDRMAAALKADLKRGSNIAVTSLLKCIHDAARGVRAELDLPVDQPWGRQLAAIRADISSMLRTAIESTPGRVRRLLRPRSTSEIAAGAMVDFAEIADTEALIELVGACRNYASELAISEMTTRVCGELQQFLDTGTKTLLDSLRAAGPSDRQFRQSQVDAAVRFCGKVFGREYASLLTKAAEVAAQGERRAPARA